MMKATEALGQILAELRSAENNAIDTNKPTMWAYFAEMHDALQGAATAETWRPDLDADQKVVENLRKVVSEILTTPVAALDSGYCYRDSHARVQRAQEASLAVYATRVLRLAGHKVPRRSLDWLRQQKRWPEGSPA